MSPTLSEQRRAGVIAALNAIIPFINLIGLVHMSTDALASSSIVVTTVVTAFFLFLPNKVEAPVGDV